MSPELPVYKESVQKLFILPVIEWGFFYECGIPIFLIRNKMQNLFDATKLRKSQI